MTKLTGMKTCYRIEQTKHIALHVLHEEDLEQIKPGCTFCMPDVDPDTVSVFDDDLEAARKEMQRFKTSLTVRSASPVRGWYVLASEYFLIEATLDEDDYEHDYEALAFSPIPEGEEIHICGGCYAYSDSEGWQKQPEEDEEE